MLFNIYLGTTAISWATTILFSKAMNKKLKREGYKYVKEKKSYLEKIVDYISTAFKLSIPVYNIINTCYLLFAGDKVYEEIRFELLANGKIYKLSEEELKNNCDNQVINTEKDNTYAASVTKFEKTYDEMTTAEKLAYLQQEKEKLINQTTSEIKNSISLNKRRK